MRKILSVIMVIAMLVTSILPAVANVAAADADALVIDMSSVGFVENEDGSATAKVDLEFTSNPGFVDLSVMVYYNTTEVGEGNDVAADGFVGYEHQDPSDLDSLCPSCYPEMMQISTSYNDT